MGLKPINRNLIKGVFSGESVVSGSKMAKDLYGNKLFGEYINKKVHYSFSEALYLVEKKKMEVFRNTKKFSFHELMEKCKKLDKKILMKYYVYKDLRNKGYLLKTALKFGADFRVYDKGKRPGKSHARWILFVVGESDDFTWQELSAKNRVAHSTKKNLLIGIFDSETSITYYEISWKKP